MNHWIIYGLRALYKSYLMQEKPANVFIALCLPGYVSETGLSTSSEACYPCPSGFFQEAAGQRGCLECPRTNSSVLNPRITKLKGLSSILQCPEIEKSSVNDNVRHRVFHNKMSFLHGLVHALKQFLESLVNVII